MDTSQRLREAVINNRKSTAILIIERHPNLLHNPDPRNGWTNLHYAAYHGHYHICVALISLGHDRAEVSRSHDHSTALHLAASQNQEQALHYLAQHIQRSMDWRNASEKSALMVAVEEGHDPCVNMLLDFGADIELGNNSGTRPLHVAAARGHVKIIRTLVDRGADSTTPNADGWVPADYGATYQVEAYLRALTRPLSDPAKPRIGSAPTTPTRPVHSMAPEARAQLRMASANASP